MGQAARKMCHTHEISFEPGGTEEWQSVDEWSEDRTEPPRLFEGTPTRCRACCVPNDSKVEEVLVVHHVALQKIGFLLRHDELQGCESPAIPECVTAVRRSRIQKRLQSQRKKKIPSVGEGRQNELEDDGDPGDGDGLGASEASRFETDGRCFDVFVGRLQNCGIPMRALLPSQGSEVITEDITLQLLSKVNDGTVTIGDVMSDPSRIVLAMHGAEKIGTLHLPLSSVMCVVCIDPTSTKNDGNSKLHDGVVDDGKDGSDGFSPSAVVEHAATLAEDKRLLEIFQLCDEDGDGRIRASEVSMVCREHSDISRFFGFSGPNGRDDASREQLDTFFQKLDPGGNSVPWVDFRDFYKREVAARFSVGKSAASAPVLHDNLHLRPLAELAGVDATPALVAQQQRQRCVGLARVIATTSEDTPSLVYLAITSKPHNEVCHENSLREEDVVLACGTAKSFDSGGDSRDDAHENTSVVKKLFTDADVDKSSCERRSAAMGSCVNRDNVKPREVKSLWPQQLLFLNAEDAEDFKSWMKHFYSSQIVCV
eukprot:TRINITY_DN29462_c0_g1_i1.p1 TRINITY_DN29462_c0_g1~~TRINITY_DN29462_c0_g1_i1.p1  ORF type:complete len:540 (-),score=103.22 TRINITY_DN29462_c0_g1_i1:43-1662(-)